MDKWYVELWHGNGLMRQFVVSSPDDISGLYFDVGILCGKLMSCSSFEAKDLTVTIRLKS